MRVAISGAHRTGKTTLVEELVASCPGFRRFDEPYYQLLEEGYAFGEMPSLEDFEAMLDRSIRTLTESEGDCLFDRCPSDIIAYLVTHTDSGEFDLRGWLPRVRAAVRRLDLVAFVPIERPDRIAVANMEDGGLRECVHRELEEIVLDDSLGFQVPVIEVTGKPEDRVRQVLEYLAITDSRR